MVADGRQCVLLIEGNEGDARTITKALMGGQPNALVIECATELRSALERIRQGGVRALILDIEWPWRGDV